jgi:pyruvate ferredoxin oxidoreductase gamma subunit
MARRSARRTVRGMVGPPSSTFEVRVHGRGGQGVVTAAELLSVAAFREGHHAQAFPMFGSERTGAPVMAFCRISSAPIRTHEPVAHPDALVIQDATLLHQVAVFSGLRDAGCVVINTTRSPDELGIGEVGRIATLPATELAREHIGRPLPGAPLLGALAALTGIVSVDALCEALDERFPPRLAEANAAAARAGHDLLVIHA